jgi:hypothetical protein
MEPTGRTIQGASPSLERPAFYALRPGGWRDLVTLLHPPYTASNLANLAIGAALAPHLHPRRLAAALAAFFLAVGICAHVLDELELRRRTVSLTGEQRLVDGSIVSLDAARMAAPMERALQACAVAMVLLATGLVLARL